MVWSKLEEFYAFDGLEASHEIGVKMKSIWGSKFVGMKVRVVVILDFYLSNIIGMTYLIKLA